MGVATNKEVNASKGSFKKLREFLEKHRGIFISLGRTVDRAPSKFEFAVNLKPGTRLVKQPTVGDNKFGRTLKCP